MRPPFSVKVFHGVPLGIYGARGNYGSQCAQYTACNRGQYLFVVRAFVKLREMLTTHKELAQKLADLERRLEDHDEQFKIVFDAIRALMASPEKPRKKIYPVKSMSPPPAGLHYQDGSITLNLPRVVNFI